MRILWFNHRDIMHPRAGGAERTIYEVGKRLAASGNEVHLASVNPGSLRREEIIDGIIIHRADGNIRAHLLVPYMLKKLKPDVVVDDLAHVIPWFSPLFTSTRVIVFFRHLHARSLKGQVPLTAAQVLMWLERRYPTIYGKCTFVTETSTGVSDLVRLGVKEERIRKVPPGVDTNLFKPGKKTDKPTLIYFGGMREYKRPWLAVETLRLLSDIEGIRLTVLGDGKELDKLKKLSEEYGLARQVIFKGRVLQDELARLISESWVNLHFSVTEGFGLTILESAACGTPTVAMEAPGVSEVIMEYGLGKIVGDLNEIPDSLNEIFVNYGIWFNKVRKSAALFSWDKCTESWEKILTWD